MKTGFKKKTMIAALTLACMCSLTGGAMLAASAEENEPATTVQTLDGFECKGASVNAEVTDMRFQFNLSESVSANYKDKTAGVVYMPYDLYTGDTANFTKDTEQAATATFTWTNAENDSTDMVGYTYMNTKVIPDKMYNRILLVRGYIVDGENVYYTAPKKTSMAYSAWKGIDVLGATYETQLKKYMGPYTLTYGDGENDNVSKLYYGDKISGLPETIGDFTVEKWYWDAARTQEIKANDYATGSMQIYYALEDVSVSINGTVSCAESSVDLSTVKISVDGVEQSTTVDSNGRYNLTIPAGKHDLKFYCDGYVGFAYNFNATSGATIDNVTLVSNLFEIGDYKNTKSTTKGYDRTDTDGTIDVGAENYNLLFPNTATKDDFTFKFNPTKNNSAVGATTHYGVAISNGTKILSITFGAYRVDVNVSESGAEIGHRTGYGIELNNGGQTVCSGTGSENIYVERSSERIVIYRQWIGVNGPGKQFEMFTINASGVTLKDSNSHVDNIIENTLTSADFAGFFGDEVELAVGVCSPYGDTTNTNYVCEFTKNSATQAQSCSVRDIDVIADDDRYKA